MQTILLFFLQLMFILWANYFLFCTDMKLNQNKKNKEKIVFFMHDNAVAVEKQLVKVCTCISRGQFPLKYLKYPITHAINERFIMNN